MTARAAAKTVCNPGDGRGHARLRAGRRERGHCVMRLQAALIMVAYIGYRTYLVLTPISAMTVAFLHRRSHSSSEDRIDPGCAMVVEQQSNSDTAIGGAADRVEQQSTRPVGVPDIILKIESAFGRPCQQRAPGKRVACIRQLGKRRIFPDTRPPAAKLLFLVWLCPVENGR